MTTIKILCATLYTVLAIGVNPLLAQETDIETIKALRAGDMRLVNIHAEPKKIIEANILDVEGNEIDLSAYLGKTVLLNFWATWCAPCRAEMPSLDALNRELGGDQFAVVTIATGRNPVPMVQQFFKETNINTLPILRDPTMGFARQSGVLGLPVTLILNPQGHEIARMQGEADWNSTDAKKLLQALIMSDL